ncbi:hypothetical protein SP21_31 [Salmonella phage 21]|nr:hypothetical protein SP21_31 [Salmonella phage 21]
MVLFADLQASSVRTATCCPALVLFGCRVYRDYTGLVNIR